MQFSSSFLYEYITNEKLGKLSKISINNSNNVASYPKKMNFFSYDRHFIPINQDNEHWSMCVVDTMNLIFYNLDSLNNESTNERVCNSVMKYVKWELENINS